MRKGAAASGFAPGSKLWKSLRAAVGPAAQRVARRQRLVHDPPDGAGASSALGAAAEAAIDFAAGPRRILAGQGRANIVVGQHVTRTDDHHSTVPAGIGRIRNYAI